MNRNFFFVAIKKTSEHGPDVEKVINERRYLHQVEEKVFP